MEQTVVEKEKSLNSLLLMANSGFYPVFEEYIKRRNHKHLDFTFKSSNKSQVQKLINKVLKYKNPSRQRVIFESLSFEQQNQVIHHILKQVEGRMLNESPTLH